MEFHNSGIPEFRALPHLIWRIDRMHQVAAELGCFYILMHWRGHSVDMNSKAIYGDVVTPLSWCSSSS